MSPESESIYMVRLRCVCGASYAIGMVDVDCEPTITVKGFGDDLTLSPATDTDDLAVRGCGICGRNVLRDFTEYEIEDVVEVVAGTVCGPGAVLDRVIRPSRFFWDPDFSGDGVLPAEHWETTEDLARLTVGRSSETK